MASETFSVPEVSCGTCQNALEGALNPLEGVRRASVDVAARQVSVDYDETLVGRSALVATIDEQGYDVAE